MINIHKEVCTSMLVQQVRALFSVQCQSPFRIEEQLYGRLGVIR